MNKISKTNIGQRINKHNDFVNEGSPNLNQKKQTLGSITDIRYPEDKDKEGAGIQVQIEFDRYDKAGYWFTLNTDYGALIASVGNAEAVRKLRPRVLYTYVPSNFENGIAELICDNTQEESYSFYQRNRCNNFTGLFSSITYNLNPPGF